MDNPFGALPVLPIVAPLGLLMFLLLLGRLHARGHFSLPRAAVALALSIYAAGVIANTVFPIFLNAPDSGEPWQPAVALVPFADYEIDDALMNVGVFLPLGMLIPLLLTRPTCARVVLTAAGTSLAIELAQFAADLFFAGGHISDVNDFLSNVAGGAIGYGLFVAATRVPALTRLIDRFRWAGTRDARAHAGDRSGVGAPADTLVG